MRDMLAPEMAAHFVVAPDLKVGDLAVFTDYAGRTLGCRITRVFPAGSISRLAHYEVKICGLTPTPPYEIGYTVTVEASKVKGAF